MQRVYVVVNRRTGFIYGITQSLETARRLLGEACAQTTDIVSISDEPLLP